MSNNGSASDCGFCLIKEELIALRREIESLTKELFNVERNCLVAVAAIYTWIFSNKGNNEITDLILLVPLFIALIGTLQSLTLWNRIKLIRGYILTMEQNLIPSPNKGWESFFKEKNNKFLSNYRIAYWVFFIFLILISYWKLF
ncbi:hypothetical protein [Solidesulfovibrio sp.]